MSQILSRELIDFFLDIELFKSSDVHDKDSFSWLEFSSSTNQYSISFVLRYNNVFDKNSIDREIKDLLVKVNHPVSDEIIDGLIIFFSILEKTKRTPEILSLYFSLVAKTKLKQYLFFKAYKPEQIPILKMRDFYIGDIDYEKFHLFIKNHTGSDYADKYQAESSNKAGIEIKGFEINIIDIYKWHLLVNNGEIKIDWQTSEIINFYLTAVASECYEEFKFKFYKQQEFINAYCGVYLSLKELELLGNTFVNIFYNFLSNSKAGWVLPVNRGIKNINFPDSRVLKWVNTFSEKNEDYLTHSKGAFSKYLESINGFFSNAEKSIHRGNLSNAYIEYFVGLDFLLAPDTEKSKKLKQRISLLVHKDLKNKFEDQLIRLDLLYDIRSNYVHNGLQVEEQSLIELRNICRVVLSILLQLHKQSIKNNKLTSIDWLTKIDNLGQYFYKGKLPNTYELSLIGIKEKRPLFLQYDLLNYPV